MTRRTEPELRVGCSGWNYASWKGRFYPGDLPAARWLPFYARAFDCVEINNTFYRLPEATTFAAWREQTPDGFLMAVKASRFLTHMKRLREPAEPLDRLFSRVAALGARLGPVLYQLPGNFHLDLARLEGFVKELPRTVRAEGTRVPVTHVIELRHPSWYVGETWRVLDRHGVSLCLHDKAGSTIAEPRVGPAVYVRFHGTSGHYHGSYPSAMLDRRAARLAEDWQDGRDVFAFFNNDPDATATENARTLRKHLERRLGRPVAPKPPAAVVVKRRR
jgi:uncharacterized protein YecE (DUF72 family)